MHSIKALAAALLITAISMPVAFAQTDDSGVAGHFQVRLRGVAVLPDAGGSAALGGKPFPGSIGITNSFVPEIDGTYFLTDHIGVEVIAATTQHSVHFTPSGSSKLDLGSAWLLPPTVTAQYHFDPEGAIRPYVGAGINYTFFYDTHSGALPDMKYENNLGWALQAGADVPVGDGPYFLNFDVKKLFLTTHVKALDGLVTAHADINPWLIGAGVGIRF